MVNITEYIRKKNEYKNNVDYSLIIVFRQFSAEQLFFQF